MQFYIGQVFYDTFPMQAAYWCNKGQEAHIQETGTTVITVTPEAVIDPITGQSIQQQSYQKEVRVFTIVKNPAPPQPTVQEILKKYQLAVQAHLDSIAQSRDYDNTYTCLSYLSSTDQTWNRESHAFNVWRDQVWRKCHQILNSFMAGQIQQPSIQELISQLPVIDWNDPV